LNRCGERDRKIEIREVVEAMDTIELKFLLKLLGEADYRAPLSKVQTTRQRHQTEKGFVVNYVSRVGGMFYEITKLKIAPQEKPTSS